MRSKQSGKELGEIARMTETCLLSDRHSLSVTAGPTLTSANVHTQLLEWLFERRNSLLQSERQLERQECKREAGEWVQWARREQPVARTGQYAPMHLPPPPPTSPPSTPQICPPPLLPFHLHRCSLSKEILSTQFAFFPLLRGHNIIFTEKCFHALLLFSSVSVSNPQINGLNA